MDYAHPYTEMFAQPKESEDPDRAECRRLLAECYRVALKLPDATRLGAHSVPELMMVTSALLVAVAEAVTHAGAYIEEMSRIKRLAEDTIDPLRTIAGTHAMLGQAAVVNEAFVSAPITEAKLADAATFRV